MDTAIVIVLVVALIAAAQLAGIWIMWQRIAAWMRMQEPRTATVILREHGPDPAATARLLARYTRLDLKEVDEIVDERQTGPLPLRLAPRDANTLAAELRQVGTAAEVRV